MCNAQWSAGGHEHPFGCVVTFYVGEPGSGKARPLPDHSVDWLGRLLTSAAAAADATLARIYPRDLFRLLNRTRDVHDVGAVTLAPHGIDVTALPASVTAHPCPTGLLLVADLDRVANNPASLIDDLLTVADLLRQTAEPAV